MKDLLSKDRESTTVQIAALVRDRDGILESAAMSASDDEHDPEGATVVYERAHIEAQLDRAQQHLVDLDEATERLARQTYGVCESCGRPIALARLKARPTTKTCIDCANRRR
ncbi:TraR/DksA family transcriptional regulator [Rhizohabitans arisaemae]|uniref:TraR/DksA family transcriptional regulator n=1 Tax=Rhizohabitans arisaemae TaxID=2720610 RepID=UPI0024B27840|nr:TraR/DksA family transcriptional regulator [Rhizohabitans arisaemae]